MFRDLYRLRRNGLFKSPFFLSSSDDLCLSASLVNVLLLPTWEAVFKEIFFYLLESVSRLEICMD